MGAPKASLEWHGSTLVRHVAGILARALDGPVVIVRAPGQRLPPLPAAYAVVEDGRAGRGPLEGLAAGLGALDALGPPTEVAFVACTDAPLLHPAYVAAILAGLRADDDICVPVVGGITQPLAGAYRAGVATAVAALLAADRLRLSLVLECCRVHRLGPEELLADTRLAQADPQLQSLVNLNRPEDYAAARSRPPPVISVLCRGGPAETPVSAGPARVARAATLAGAAAAAGVRIGEGVRATVNGRPAGDDQQLPLVAGDAVVFAAGEGPGRARRARGQ